MSGLEILVVLIGLVGGYFGVSKLFFPTSNTARNPGRGLVAQRPWFEVLKLAEDSSVDAIREARRRLMEPFQPDKMASLQGDLYLQATAAVNEIRRAYEEGMRARGAAP